VVKCLAAITTSMTAVYFGLSFHDARFSNARPCVVTQHLDQGKQDTGAQGTPHEKTAKRFCASASPFYVVYGRCLA
jgi:hypothetical protein